MARSITRIVPEKEFRQEIQKALNKLKAELNLMGVDFVTGPGRSGAVAAVYASHILSIPFVPFGQMPKDLDRALVIDTAIESGATMRKAVRKYTNYAPIPVAIYQEPPRVTFWYEAPKPQRLRKKKENKSFAEYYDCPEVDQ